MENNHENSWQMFQRLRNKMALINEHNYVDLMEDITLEMMIVRKAFLEEERKTLESKKNIPMGGFITHSNVEDLDRGFLGRK